MSIIATSKRNTSDAAAFQSQKSSDASLILIESATTVEDFSIELTIGSAWSRRYGQTNEMITIPEEGIRLAVGESVVVEVAERIGVPHNLYGLVIPTGRLFLDQGIIIAAAKIEPSFNDRLKLRLVNASGERRTLKRGQKIASAVFFSTERTVVRAEFQKRAVEVSRGPDWRKRAARWSRANWPTIVGWVLTIFCSSVMAAFITHALQPGPAAVKSAPPTPPTTFSRNYSVSPDGNKAE